MKIIKWLEETDFVLMANNPSPKTTIFFCY